MHSLDYIFKPRSVAIVGATNRRGSIAHELLHNVIMAHFNGKIFPVNPKYEYIHSIKAYPSVLSIPDDIDLAIIIVPKQHVLMAAEDCGRKGVRALVVISAGFKEEGEEGVERELKLIDMSNKYNFRIVGPNCMGLINATTEVSLNATFAPMQPQPGHLAMMSQSGALGVAILLAVERLNLGLSYFISVGNKADVSGNDLLEYWENEDSAKVIALYLESFGRPRRFTEVSKRMSKKKPIVVVKSGTSAAGARAASSHTGALAGMDIAADALLRQCGVIRVSTIEEMIDLVAGLTKCPLPKGDRVGILTNAGGPGIMAADAVENEGMRIADFSEETMKGLKKFLPAEASGTNPIDMLAGAGALEYEKGAELILSDDNVDMMINIFVPPLMIEPKEVIQRLTAVVKKHDKPVFSVLMAQEESLDEIRMEIKDAPPFYYFPESAVGVAAKMLSYERWRTRDEGEIQTYEMEIDDVKEIACAKQKEGGGYLTQDDTFQVLDKCGFPICRHASVPKDGDIIKAADEVKYPLVMKVDSKDLIHKSDIGGVIVGINGPKELEAAKLQIDKNLKKAKVFDQATGYFLQEMALPGKEVILGMTLDERFGPLLMFGMGGKYVEILKDIAFRVMPVTDMDAWEMIRSLRGYPLLEGVRGEERVDLEFIMESICRLAQLLDNIRCIEELDLNPVIITPKRKTCRVVDARIRVSDKEELY